MNVPYNPRHAKKHCNKQGTEITLLEFGKNVFFGVFEFADFSQGHKRDLGLSYDPHKGKK